MLDRRGGAGGRPPGAAPCRNRDLLLDVASAAFAREGVDASLERIAKDAGVGIGTLSRPFPNRDALMEAVYRHNPDQLIADADELSATKPPVEALEEFMQRFVAYVATKKGLATHLKTVVTADSDLFNSSHERMTATLNRLVAAAVESGGIRNDVDPGDLLRALAGVCMTSDMTQSQDQPCRISRLLMGGMRLGGPPPR